MKGCIVALTCSGLIALCGATAKPNSLAKHPTALKLAGPTTVTAITYTNTTFAFPSPKVVFDVEQTLNIGSQTSGVGAGKITFNPISITKKVDDSTPLIFQMACSGTAFQTVTIAATNFTVVLKLAAVKTDSFTIDSEGNVVEILTLEYGTMTLTTPKASAGWDRTKNVKV